MSVYSGSVPIVIVNLISVEIFDVDVEKADDGNMKNGLNKINKTIEMAAAKMRNVEVTILGRLSRWPKLIKIDRHCVMYIAVLPKKKKKRSAS